MSGDTASPLGTRCQPRRAGHRVARLTEAGGAVHRNRGVGPRIRYARSMAPVKPERVLLDVAGREVVGLEPRQGLLPRGRHHQARASSATTWPSPRARCAAPAAGPNVLVRYANGIHGEFFYQKRAPDSRPRLGRGRGAQLPVRARSAEEVVPRDARGARLDGEPRLPRAPPAPGPRRGPRSPRRAARRPRSGAGHRVGADPGGRPRRARDVLADLGLVGWPKTSGSRGIHVNVRIHRRWSFTQVRRAALALAREVERRAPGTRHQQVVEGGAPRRLPRLQPERQGPHGGGRLLGAPEARRARLGARDLGRARRVPSGGLHAARRCRRASPPIGDRHAGIDDSPCSLDALLELSARQEARGPGRRAVAAALREAGGRAAARRSRRGGKARAPAAGACRRSRSSRSAAPRRKEDALAGPRALEGAPSRGGRPPRARRRARRLDARPLSDLDARPREPGARARARCGRRQEPLDPDYASWAARAPAWRRPEGSRAVPTGPSPEDLGELGGRRDLELVVAAVRRRLVRPPAQEDGRVPEAVALQVVVLRPRTRARPAAAPTTGPCPRSSGSGRPACAGDLRAALGPVAPGMRRERVLAERLQLLRQLLPRGHGERRRHADVVQRARVVVEAEQQRADERPRALLVPAEAGHHAVRGARVLHLDHRALAGLVGACSRAWRSTPSSPAPSKRWNHSGATARSRRARREVDAAAPRRASARSSRARRSACGRARRSCVALGEQVEGDEGRRGLGRRASPPATPPGAGASAARRSRARASPTITISPSTTQRSGRPARSSGLELGEVAVERLQVAALDVELVAVAEHDARGSRPTSARTASRRPAGSSVASFASIGSIGGSIGKLAAPAIRPPASRAAMRPSAERPAGVEAGARARRRRSRSGAWSEGIGLPLRASRSISAQTRALGERARDQQVVDAHAEVLVEVAGAVVPPGVAAGLRVVRAGRRRRGPSDRAARTPRARGGETWVPPWQAARVPHVGVRGRDVEVAAEHQRLRRGPRASASQRARRSNQASLAS